MLSLSDLWGKFNLRCNEHAQASEHASSSRIPDEVHVKAMALECHSRLAVVADE